MLLFHNRQPTITERSECEANAEDKGLKNEDFAASEMSSLCQGRERERERERGALQDTSKHIRPRARMCPSKS